MSALEVATTIAIPSWMNDTVLKVMSLFNEGQEEPRILIVGGAVRDSIIEKPVSDFDLATTLTPEEATKLLEAAGVKVIPTGLQHGTITAVVEGEEFQITTLRKDIETDGRHAVVRYTTDWVEDAKRRDFTINTLLMDEKGDVFDPLRQGVDDLGKGRIVFVGKAEERIQEDYLRILRFFRFYAYYALGEPDQDALYACADHRQGIDSLSRERITAEVFKLLQAPQPMNALNKMFSCDILTSLKHEQFDEGKFVQLCEWYRKNNMSDVWVRLVSLAAFQQSHIKHYESLFILSKAQKRHLYETLGAYLVLKDRSDKSVRTSIFYFGSGGTLRALMMHAALNDDPISALNGSIGIVNSWEPPKAPVGAADLEVANIEKGPAYGRILKAFEAWWVEKDFPMDRDESLSVLRDIIDSHKVSASAV